jgi:hypothetical protein
VASQRRIREARTVRRSPARCPPVLGQRTRARRRHRASGPCRRPRRLRRAGDPRAGCLDGYEALPRSLRFFHFRTTGLEDHARPQTAVDNQPWTSVVRR